MSDAGSLQELRIARSAFPKPSRTDVPLTVTVVIPCFNYGRFLPAAVGSVLSQEECIVDIVVVDDASTDDSLDIARRLAKADTRIRVISHEINEGPVKTFNDGLAEVTGEFLVRLDADDMLTPGSLSRAAAVARAYPRVGLVYGHPLHFRDEPLPVARTVSKTWTIWPGMTWLADRCLSGKSVITSPEVFMRTSVVARVGGQKPLAHAHDMEMWMRIAAVSDVAHIEGADQAWHRDHDQSLSARLVDGVTDLHERERAFDVLFSGIGRSLRGADELHSTARHALVCEALSRACHEYDRGRGDSQRTAAFINFAMTTGDDSTDLRQWRELRWRQRVGSRLCKWVPIFTLHAALRKASAALAYRRWTREGV